MRRGARASLRHVAPVRHALLRALAVAGIVAVGHGARADEPIDADAAVRLARDVRPAVVRLQWRRRAAPFEVVDRHAVVVDPNGWLLMAGPCPSPEGTLAATFEDGRAMPAQVWARDEATCLTLLRVPAVLLPPLSVRAAPAAPADRPSEEPARTEATRPDHRPRRSPAGLPFLMVTAEGAVARGAIRANHRRRLVRDPLRGSAVEVTCLDEAALSAIPADLGAPWLDAEGRIVGLLVGADLGVPGEAAEAEDTPLRPEVTAAYAVPGEVIEVVWPLLKVNRQVPRAALGVYVRRLSDATRQHVCPDCGAYEVLEVAPGGAAHRAGVQPQDIIRAVEGHTLAPEVDLADVLLPHRPGTRLRLGLFRRGAALEMQVVLGRSE